MSRTGLGIPMTFPNKLRPSACARQSRQHELERLRRMSVEDRIKAALSIGERFAWLKPTKKRS